MKKVIACMFAAAMLVGGFAFANNGIGAGQGCYVENAFDGGPIDVKNPGKFLQAIRAATGLNPAQAVKYNPGPLTVGEGIAMVCGVQP